MNRIQRLALAARVFEALYPNTNGATIDSIAATIEERPEAVISYMAEIIAKAKAKEETEED